MFDVITIGDTTLDTFLILDEDDASCDIHPHKKLLCLRYAEKTPIAKSDQSVGGNAANVAVGVQKLGLKTSIVTELGDDINGHVIYQAFKDAKVDTRYITQRKNRETRYSVILNYKAERTVLSYHDGTRYRMPKLPNCDWIYYTSLGPTFPSVQKKIHAHLEKHPRTKLAMNPGSYQMKKGIDTIRTAIAKTDILFVNKEEAQTLIGKRRAVKNCLRDLHTMGAKTIVITDGTRGSYCYDGDDMLHMSIFPIEAKAKTGAGDAYSSGFLAARAYEKDLATAMQWGSANAAGVIQDIGAQNGLLTKRKIHSIIRDFPTITPTPLT